MAVVFPCIVHDQERLEGTLCAAHDPGHAEEIFYVVGARMCERG